MTHTEFGLLASSATWTEHVRLTGQVTAVTADAVVLTRWVPGCCSMDAALDVLVVDAPAEMVVGDWWRVDGRAVVTDVPVPVVVDEHRHGGERPRPPALQASGGERLGEALPRMEV